MFQTTNQILSYIKYRNHQKDRNVLPGWYGWYWPHRVSRFNRCELPSYFCCEPIIEFLVPSFLLSFWRVQIAFIRDVLEVDQLTGFSEGKMLMQYYHGETIQSWDVLIYIYIIPYLSISIHIYGCSQNLDTMEPRPQTTAKGNPEGPSRQWGYQETTTWENQFIGRSPNGHHFLGRAVDGSWDPDLEVS